MNSLGQREKVETVGTAFGVAPVWNWSYNPRGELVSAMDTSANSRDLGYIYDAIGNRVATGNVYSVVNGTEQVTNPVAYTANALNQYTVANGVSLPTTPAPAPHDLDGNLRFDGGVNKDNEAREYLWDAENRLSAVKRVSDGATVVSFLYDAQSRRIAKKAGTTTTLYIYDSFNCIAEYSISNNQYSISRARLWGIDLSGTLQGAGGVGGLLAETQGTSTFYPTFDGNGNISEYLTANGAVAAHFEYDPFGNIVKDSYSTGFNATSFTYKFSTKPLDAETGLYYYQYRYLDPLTGRWPSSDPIGERGGVNLYGMVKNNIVNDTDYLGLDCTQLSFEWKNELEIVNMVTEWNKVGAGIRMASSITFKWEGRAEVECCCNNRKFSAQGTMVGETTRNVNSETILDTSYNLLPLGPSPGSVGNAIGEILLNFINTEAGGAPGSEAARDLAGRLRDIIDEESSNPPDSPTWKDGWPCQ